MQETSEKKCKSGSMPDFFWAVVASCIWRALLRRKALSMCFSQFQENEPVVPLQRHAYNFYASHLKEQYL